MNQFPINSLYSRSSGTFSTAAFVEFFSDRDPTIYDVNFPIQKRWLNVISGVEFILVSFDNSQGFLVANWYQITGGGSGEGGLTWSRVTTSTKAMNVNNGYITVNATVTYLLPSSAELGEVIEVVGQSGIAQIIQDNFQQIIFGNRSTTFGGLGFLQSTKNTDCIILKCISAGTNTVFSATSQQGNWVVN